MKFFISTLLSTVLLFSLAACSHSSEDLTGASTEQKQSQTDNTTEKTDEDTTDNKSGSSSANDNNQSGLDQRIGVVMNAALKYESQQPNTTVDYKYYTITQDKKKVRLTIETTADHKDDFKEGFVKEVVDNTDESHDVTLFQYKVDDNNTVSLIDTKTEKVVYTEKITEAEKLGDSEPTGEWVETFEKKLYEAYHVTPSRYEYIGNGNWEVWVKETDTGDMPYVTVNQNTGDFHG